MISDPLAHVARDKALLRRVSDYIDLEIQLDKSAAHRPVVTMLGMARDEAAEAMVSLSLVDPAKTEDIRALQNIVVRFDDLVKWARKIIADGRDAEVEVESRSDSFEDVVDYLRDTDQMGEAEMLGITERTMENADA